MLANISIRTKIVSVVAFLLVALTGMGLMAVWKMRSINANTVDITTNWFKRWGSLTVFVCRFVPVIRHLISIPAGIARMNLLKFCIYTVIGATMWNTFLMWLGYKLEAHMKDILKYRSAIDIAIVLVLILGVVAWYWIHLRTPAPEKVESKR